MLNIAELEEMGVNELLEKLEEVRGGIMMALSDLWKKERELINERNQDIAQLESAIRRKVELLRKDALNDSQT